jgi:helix-turn-helix protein
MTRRPTLLVIDDDEAVGALVKKAAEPRGFTVVCEHGGGLPPASLADIGRTKTAAANELGISRRSLYRWIERLHIDA